MALGEFMLTENKNDIWKSQQVWVLRSFFSKALNMWEAKTKKKKKMEEIRGMKENRNNEKKIKLKQEKEENG